MKIAILSDTHSRTATVKDVLRRIDEAGVDLLIHCGDLEDDDTVLLFPANTHFVFGNCDVDHACIRRAVHEIGATLHEPFGHLELEGVRIAFTHGDVKRLLHELEHGGDYDYLFYGHTHVAMEHQTGKTRVINPGALHRARPKSFVILHLPEGRIESVHIED